MADVDQDGKDIFGYGLAIAASRNVKIHSVLSHGQITHRIIFYEKLQILDRNELRMLENRRIFRVADQVFAC
jgi:hypothetical protein